MRISLRTTWVRPAAALASLLLLCGCGGLLTGDSETGRRNWAVVVGVASYDSPALDLKWADEDALDFYDMLRHGKNWEAEKITLLTNGLATKDAIKAALAGLARRVSADDQVVFYFSGRGSYGPDQPPFDEGDGLDEYLLPYDAQPNSPVRDLSDDELEALLSALPTNNVLIVIDAGFSGAPARSGVNGKEKSHARGSGRTTPRGLDGVGHDLARPGYILLTAGLAGEPVLESTQLRNGVFTHYLVEGLGGAANAGKKSVSAQQAFEFAAPRTSSFSAGQAPQAINNRGKDLKVVVF